MGMREVLELEAGLPASPPWLGSGSTTTTSDGLVRLHVENGSERGPCPGECGATVEWVFLERAGKRIPGMPPYCGACAALQLPERQEALRLAAEENARVAAEGAAARDRMLLEGRQAAILDVLRSAGVNTREHGRVSLSDFDVSEAGRGVPEECWRFIHDARRAGRHDAVVGLYLAGTTGNGKTQLAVAVMRELLLDPTWTPYEVVFDVAAELLTEVQATYRGEGSTMAVKQRRIDARVWVLDDLGTERPTEDAARVLYEIVNARALAPTVITSNLAPSEIEKRHPELARVVSRLGPAYFRGVRVKGKDRRYLKREPMQPAAD